MPEANFNEGLKEELDKTFGPNEARLFLQRHGLPTDNLDPISAPLCAALLNSANTIEALSQQVSKLREEKKQLSETLNERDQELVRAATTIQEITRIMDNDPLTGLPNRRDFEGVLKRMIARRERKNSAFPRASVIFIDVNNFKQFNTELTHHGGDLALKHIAGILRSNLREGDYVARVGGDEFAAIVYDVTKEEAHDIAKLLMKALLDKPLVYSTPQQNNPDKTAEHHETIVPLSITCGVKRIHKDDTPESLIHRTSEDMLETKQKSKSFAEAYLLAKKQLKNFPDLNFKLMPTQADLRRTFAIISHPDAGKTTLTEKLLLFGGAIHLAGAVKAKKGGQSARSDWMAIEQQRGISVTASVMTFEYKNHTVNLLDTPGHKDFSEDTYRTLTAVDSAVMVLDAAKGIEEQTLKLFEVCRLRDTPVITFINKMDREAKEPFDLLDEIEKTLALDVCPITWPIGMGERFRGCFNLMNDSLYLFDAGHGSELIEAMQFTGVDDPKLSEHIPEQQLVTLREEVAMVRAVYPAFNPQSYREGHLTPVFFGSAINNFGVRELLEALCNMAPPPREQAATTRTVTPEEEKFTGFVFKIQANMDKNHRDRIAFVRICSGKYRRGMKVLHVRSGKTLALNNPVLFLARERELAEEAWPGDIIGIPGHGHLHIGDTLTEGEVLQFTGIPSFAPELFQRVRLDDPMKSKQLKAALEQLSEEGASQIFKPIDGSPWIIGVVGQLQFDVIASRLKAEYSVNGSFEAVQFTNARWLKCANNDKLREFCDRNKYNTAEDATGAFAYLAPNAWHLERIQKDWPDIEFMRTREFHS